MPNKNYFAQLSPKQKAELFLIYTGNGMYNLNEIMNHYNSEMDRAYSSTEKDMVARMHDINAPYLTDEEGNKMTHRMASGDDYVFPTIQRNDNGNLESYEDTEDWGAQRAIDRNDTLQFRLPSLAEYFSENYKTHLDNSIMYKDGGDIDSDNKFTARDNTRVSFIPQSLGFIPSAQTINLEHFKDVRFDDGPLGFIPVIGDALQGAQAVKDFFNGNYGKAAIDASMLLVPNFLEKAARGVKPIIKKIVGPDNLYNFFNSGKNILSKISPKFGKFIYAPTSDGYKQLSNVDVNKLKDRSIRYHKYQESRLLPDDIPNKDNKFIDKYFSYDNAVKASLRPSNRWEDFLNSWELIPSNNGYHRASGFYDSNNNGIVLFNGTIDNDTFSHEFEHAIQNEQKTRRATLKNNSNTLDLNKSYQIGRKKPSDNQRLDDVRKILQERNPGNDMEWERDLDEFGAELAMMRNKAATLTMLDDELSLEDAISYLKDIFNLRDNQETNFVVRRFFDEGYSNGGQL